MKSFFLSVVFLLLAGQAHAQTQKNIDVDTRIDTLFDLVNEYRAQNGLKSVTPSVLLAEVADWMAQDMAANNYMSHTDSLGRDPFMRMDDLGYNFNTWKGENVAAGPQEPDVTLDLWKNSPGHNANLLRSDFTVMGLGRAYGVNTLHGWYWAQEFGGYLDEEALFNPVNRQPAGALETASCSNATGWARDADTTPPSRVKVYRDGEAGAGGVFVEEFTANELRDDLEKNSGFNWAVPDSLKDGATHSIYVYAIDSDGGPNFLLTGSPKAITCPPPPSSSAVDFVMDSISLSPANPVTGDNVTFKGVVKNQGPSNAGVSYMSLRIDVDNNGTWDDVPGQISVQSLPGTASYTITLFTGNWIDIWTAASGTHKFEICADAGSSIAESDGSNNCSSMTFTVSVSSLPETPKVPQEPLVPQDTPEPLMPLQEGALIRAAGGIDVWIVKYAPATASGQAKKFKRLILSPHVFNSYGHLRWEDVIEVSQATLDTFTTSDLVRAENDEKVYRLFPQGDTGVKRWITTGEAFAANSFDWDAIYTINTIDRDSYVVGEPYN